GRAHGDAYDSDCDDISSAKAVLMANLSNYDLDVLSEITSDSNIIPYSQYLLESKDAVPDDGDDVTIDAIPLSTKSPTIVDYKIYKEGKKSYFQIIRADGDSHMYLTFGKMLKNFNREDLEVLWSIVKARFKKTEPVNYMDNFLLLNLKTMFEHHVEDNTISLLEYMDSESAHMVAASMVPMLKPENGNTAPKTTVVEGVEKVIPPTTAEEKAQKRLEVKARSTLMMGIPNEHQLKFNSIKDAKLLLEAIEKRLHNLVSQLEILGETLSQEDVNQKLLRSLSPEWNTHVVMLRNKPELEIISMDDLYNNLKSDQAEEGPTTYLLMAYSSSSSDSEVSNDSTCSKSCFETVEVLKSQYEQLLKRFEKSELMVVAYKTGNFMPPKPDLSFTGLEEFTNEPVVIKPVVENSEAKASEAKPKVVRKNNGAPIIEDWVIKNGNAAKLKAVVNVARPKAVVNAVKGNNVNVVKASACWVWKPKTKVLDHVSKHNRQSTSGFTGSRSDRYRMLKIEKEVYVCQPPGFEDPDFPDRVYKVEKALYGLHQAPRAWYETLSTYLLDNEFQRGKIDKTLFIKRYKGDILLVQVYVDDIIFGLTKKELCNAFEKSIGMLNS
ncbi:putative ribonuclease H-like domain-containing protein, partial [Tanacetum coccineum]